MADYHFTYKDVEGTTTEWDDLQVKYGNKAPKEKPVKIPWAPSEDAKAKDVGEREEEELDELEDDQFLEEYRRKRMAELQSASTAPKYGVVQQIKGAEFVREVTEAGQDVWAVVHLFKDSVAECQVLGECLQELARKYPGTKFVKMISTDCIPSYPDSNLPTLLVYYNGAVKRTIVGLRPFGGRHITSESVAFGLLQIGPVLSEAGGGGQRQSMQAAMAERIQKEYLERLVQDREREKDESDGD